MLGNFFKDTVTRGVEFFTAGGKFAVSNPPPTDPFREDNRFSTFSSKFPKRFKTFSSPRLFTSAKSNKFTTVFSIPAKNDKALVSGFGAVFADVILKGKTNLSYYDKNNCLIVSVDVDPKPKGLSFAGILVTHRDQKPVNAAVALVKTTLGNAVISGPYASWKDFVVTDDFIYGEPKAWTYY